MDVEEFRRVGHQLIDWIADYRAGMAELPVMSRVAPGDVKAQLPPAPPETPESFDAIVADLDRIIVPGLSHVQHPRFFGYFPANGELASVLYLTPAQLDGRWMVRVSIGAIPTEREHVQALWQLMRQEAERDGL